MILNLIHFNDVYRVTPQKLPGGKTIDVSQFAALLDSLREEWPKDDGLVLFSGDVFSPSVESSVTRGSHMVPVMNQIAPDVSLTGNHDFDFGYRHLTKLMTDCKFPWILSNIQDTETGKAPKGLERFKVFDRAGLRVGVIGLVEKEWIATVSSWPPNFVYQPMDQVGVELSQLLRAEPHNCDLILALTHARIPNDITLAKQLSAIPDGKSAGTHGIDVIFGGHDHMYYIGRGAEQWEGHDLKAKPDLGTEGDDGLLIVKSGTDFRDLSSMELEVIDAPDGSIRKKVVQSIRGKRHVIAPDMPASSAMKDLLATLLSDVSSTLKAPVCHTLTAFDCRSNIIRTEESASGNWLADVLKHTYDAALCMQGVGGADAVLICGGTIRGDSVYGPGLITLGDIMEILPFEDPMVVIGIDGATLWTALESALSTWPAQEGRFPILSGFRVEWDSRNPPNQRVLGIWEEDRDALDDDSGDDDSDAQSINSTASKQNAQPVKGAPVSKEPGGKVYTVVTREYMATGHDGYEALKDCKYVGGIDDEHGQLFSAIVRKYLLGLQYVNNMKAVAGDAPKNPVRPSVLSKVSSDRARTRWKDAGRKVIDRVSRRHNKTNIGSAIQAAETHHMTGVDVFDGSNARRGGGAGKELEGGDEDLVVVAPVVDGRMKNLGV